MADVQSNEASTQAHDTPSSANVEEQKSSASKKQFGASDHVVTIPCNLKSSLTCKSGQKGEKVHDEESTLSQAMKKSWDNAAHEYFLASIFVFVCVIIRKPNSDYLKLKSYTDQLEHHFNLVIQPLFVYMILRCIYITVRSLSHSVDIRYNAPAEYMDLVEKKNSEGSKKFINSVLSLYGASILLIVTLSSLLL